MGAALRLKILRGNHKQKAPSPKVKALKY